MRHHQFFDRHLTNDLFALTNTLQAAKAELEQTPVDASYLDKTGSITTAKWNDYNVFQFYTHELYTLYVNLEDMVREACDYYKIDFSKQDYYVQGWFNINNNKQTGKLSWHDHAGPGDGAPLFHGYYCVNAEPSITYYKINDQVVENHNKNNRAILSEVGHQHAMGDWDWEGDRITIAYDVFPRERLVNSKAQHWIPLA